MLNKETVHKANVITPPYGDGKEMGPGFFLRPVAPPQGGGVDGSNPSWVGVGRTSPSPLGLKNKPGRYRMRHMEPIGLLFLSQSTTKIFVVFTFESEDRWKVERGCPSVIPMTPRLRI